MERGREYRFVRLKNALVDQRNVDSQRERARWEEAKRAAVDRQMGRATEVEEGLEPSSFSENRVPRKIANKLIERGKYRTETKLLFTCQQRGLADGLVGVALL